MADVEVGVLPSSATGSVHRLAQQAVEAAAKAGARVRRGHRGRRRARRTP